VNIIPRNPIAAAADDPPNMLGVIVVALLVGIGSMTLAPEKAELVIRVLEAVGELMVFIIGLAMRIAPMGVFALIFSTTAQFGFGLLQQLGYYVIVVLLGLGVQMVVVFPILLRTLGGQSPLAFFRKCRAVIVTAFSTSSSAATLPTSIKTAEEDLRVPPPIAGFVLPLGATMNMNGTALFEGVTVMFLAQVMGADLSLGQQAVVVVMCVLTAVGAAGVPGGSIPLLAVVLATVGVEPGSIALILGVDRLLDMCRTTLNVLGDLTAAVFVTRSEAKAG
jgi:DAACS family dicarboxylate/amino acid:cation (Na+ or H+) symporter